MVTLPGGDVAISPLKARHAEDERPERAWSSSGDGWQGRQPQATKHDGVSLHVSARNRVPEGGAPGSPQWHNRKYNFYRA